MYVVKYSEKVIFKFIVLKQQSHENFYRLVVLITRLRMLHNFLYTKVGKPRMGRRHYTEPLATCYPVTGPQ
jgi:hypothetical protein